MAEDYFSFEDVLKELKMNEDELKRLVSEGEIRAFRDEDSMKFKKEDVDRLKGQEGGGEAELSFDEAGGDALGEELVFDDEDGLGLGDEEEAGMATAQISSQDTIIEDEEAEMSLEEEVEEDRPKKRASRGRGRGRTSRASQRKGRITRASGRGTRLREIEAAHKASSPLMIALLIVTFALLIYSVMVMYSAASSTSTGLTKPMADVMGGQV